VVIAAKLENSLNLAYPPERLQILVAADGSTDSTPEIVRQYAERGVELSYAPLRQGKMAAINRAMQQAHGEVVIFSDANNLYDSRALQELVKPFADSTVAVVSGAKSIVKDGSALGQSEGLYWRYESFLKKQETRLSSCTGVAGEIMALRRDLFESAPDNIINDDFYMAMRLIKRGYRVVYAPKARSYECVSSSAAEEVVRRTRIIAGRYQAILLMHQLLPPGQPLVAWQLVSHKFLRPFVPLAMIGALIANVGAVWQMGLGLYAIMLALQVGFYVLALVGHLWQPRGLLGRLLYLPTFLVNSNWAALLGLVRFLTRRQTTQWQQARRQQKDIELAQAVAEEGQVS
jgi:cellulose synthase/poly-beta-1,6-N-acetylglucosamine synthase-like glycosyltransferase